MEAKLNSEVIGIISTNNEGIIYQYNEGAEILLGYTASEMIGLDKRNAVLIKAEFEKFENDIRSRYNKSGTDANPYELLAENNGYDAREWTVIKKDGTTFISHSTLTPLKNESGENIGFLRILQDITAQKKTETELQQKNQVLNAAEKLALIGNWQWNTITNDVNWSNNLYSIFEVNPDEQITFETYYNFIHPDDRAIVDANILRTNTEKKFCETLHRIVLTSGKIKTVQLIGDVTLDDAGNVIELIGTCQDITAQKKIEFDLLRKNQLLNAAEKITQTGHWQWNVITNDVIWSNNLYNIFGIDPNEKLTYESYAKFIHPDDVEAIRLNREKSIKDKKFHERLHRIVLSSGKIKTVQILGEAILDEAGNLTEFIGTLQDVTELRMAEIKFKGLLESAPDAMIIINEQEKIQLINKQAEKLFGYSSEELLHKSVELLIPPRFKAEKVADLEILFDADKTIEMGVEKDVYGIHKEGKEIPIQINLSPLKTEEGVLVSAAIRDITNQKKIEAELKLKNQFLNYAEKLTLMGHWQWNTITNYVKWSNNLFNVFEIEPNENTTIETYYNFVHPEDKELVGINIARTKNEKKFCDTLHRIKLTSGKIKTVQLRGDVVLDDLGNVIEIIGTCQDVTEQRMAELKFRGLLESAPDAMVIVNDLGEIQLINKQAEKLFGYSAEELQNKPVELLIPERFNKHHTNNRDAFFNAPKTRKMGEGKELYGINKSGEEIPIQISLSPLKTEEGLLVSAAIRDITVQKNTESDLLRKNQVLNAAEKITMTGNWQWDYIVNHVTWSSNLFNIFEVDPEENLNFDSYFSFVHPDDKETVQLSFDKSVEDKIFYDLLHRIVSTSGKVKTIQLHGDVITDTDGKVIELIGTCQDVTQQHMAEKKILEANERLELLASTLKTRNTQLADFAHITSHNLRAPVSNLNSLLGFYNNSETEEEKIFLFKKFEIVIDHLTETLNTLIQALRTKNEGAENLESLTFDEVLSKTKEILAGQILKTEAKIISDFSKNVKITYNRTYLESIFLNLLSNAMKYKSDDRIPEIFIHSEIKDGIQKLSFKDNGLGIDLKRHGHKMFGLNKVFHRHPDAKGVGLFMTKVQVESMGGTISVESKVNVGSTFNINFK
ncbi:PAS domain S-box protein [Aurantibacter crassamenti]|uniref:PAS domain S-box protein n=1 Tax=Aurantibacter crassamenti TaxID=1837375 RepID=UPI0019395B38|nr:PAS domain S-box protein [Aurantibacter crassamenti]MBM1104520.1 PAS domain S-box protein [Aurantibacter crassamenti]